jgi:hypothetical protein
MVLIGDSGASNCCNSDVGLYNCVAISKETTVGNGNVIVAKKLEKQRCVILQENGKGLIVTFDNVKFEMKKWNGSSKHYID